MCVYIVWKSVVIIFYFAKIEMLSKIFNKNDIDYWTHYSRKVFNLLQHFQAQLETTIIFNEL